MKDYYCYPHYSRRPSCGCEGSMKRYHDCCCETKRECLIACSEKLKKCLVKCRSSDNYCLECCVQDAIRCFDRCFY